MNELLELLKVAPTAPPERIARALRVLRDGDQNADDGVVYLTTQEVAQKYKKKWSWLNRHGVRPVNDGGKGGRNLYLESDIKAAVLRRRVVRGDEV